MATVLTEADYVILHGYALTYADFKAQHAMMERTAATPKEWAETLVLEAEVSIARAQFSQKVEELKAKALQPPPAKPLPDGRIVAYASVYRELIESDWRKLAEALKPASVERTRQIAKDLHDAGFAVLRRETDPFARS